MPPATEWSKVVLHSMRGGLVSLARRLASPAGGSAPAPTRTRHEDDDPFGPLLDTLEALNSEQRELRNRLTCLEEAGSLPPIPPDTRDSDPLGPLFDALESINDVLTGFASRLTRLEDTSLQTQFRCRSAWLVNGPKASAATVRAARRRRARRAVSHA